MTQQICPHCGTIGKPIKQPPGSIWIELILWLTFLLPGIIYSVWRITSMQHVCPSCGKEGMIPTTSPMGQALSASVNQTKAPSHKDRSAMTLDELIRADMD